MDYQTFTPTEHLAAFVNCYWTLNAPKEDSPTRQRIIPDGCMEMIFHHGDLYRQYMEDGSSIIQPRCFVFGQITTPLDVEPTGETGIFSVRFNPEGFIPFATIAVTEIENKAVSLEIVFGEQGRELAGTVLNASQTEDKIWLVEQFLLERLATPEAVFSVVRSSVELMMQLKGQVNIEELSEQVKTHRRQLERKFSSVIGLSPKQLSKMIRLRATLKMLATKQVISLTALAYEGAYYDQAHFIKDFKEFTGMSPKKFYSDNLKMSALFIGTE